jgi:hypothetical protein
VSVVTKAVLKTYFQRGLRPTQSNYVDLIDTMVANGGGAVTLDSLVVSGSLGVTGDTSVGGSMSVAGVLNAAGGFTTTPEQITNTMLNQMAANTVKVNATAVSASPTDTALAVQQLLGRGTANIAPIALGTGLSIAANTLNMIEAGLWTPALNFGGSVTGITYTSQSGKYTKIGDVYYLRGILTLSSKGAQAGSATLTGIPAAASGFAVGAVICNANGTSWPNNAYLLSNGSSLLLRYDNGTGVTDIADTNFTNTTTIIFTIMYNV